MKIKRMLSFAATGWVAGVITAIGMGLCWPIIFPALVRPEHYYGYEPSRIYIIGLAIVFASPITLIGGLLASRVPREGGSKDAYVMAVIAGGLLTIPFACYFLWLFTGW